MMRLAVALLVSASSRRGVDARGSSCSMEVGMNVLRLILVSAALSHAPVADAASLTLTMNVIDAGGVGRSIGTVEMRDTRYGLLIAPKLSDLPPGLHGFHVHENPACGSTAPNSQVGAGLAAGGHYDPAKTGKHLGPEDRNGHLGDLPVLVVDPDGTATLPVLAPRLKVKDVKDRSLMVHAGQDNYSDQPAPLGGGGARIACGVIK
jgi:superoxide dismutase, Cu-Zn family